jgi:glucose/arabinose dehydrogenase
VTSNYGSSYRLILIAFLALVTACSQMRPTSPPGSFSSQSAQTAGPTPTLPEENTATSEPAPTPLTETPTPTQVQRATPTVQVPHTPVSGPEDTTQSTALPTFASPAFPPAISLEPVLAGFELPVFVTHAGEEPSGASRLFIVEKAGRIQLVESGSVQPTPFLDITDRVGSQRNEQGLLSVAFPPDFAASGLFYVNYTDRRGDTVVARYQLMSENPRQADPSREQKILQIEQPAANHNGGQLQFGPDGYLYIGTGDGGQAGDPWGNAQNPDELLGKMLRIDVTGTDSYQVPSDNPTLNQPGVRPEIWATGLRNPWRFSFDRATGDLYIADVGQNLYEEVNFQPAGSSGGENYGWDVMEASNCFEPPTGCDSDGLVMPVTEYDHGQGCSITGGYVYRGTLYPRMAGVYFFGDFCSGNIWGLRQEASGKWEMALLLDTDLNISSLGEDSDGEIYVVSYSDGSIYHLAASPPE